MRLHWGVGSKKSPGGKSARAVQVLGEPGPCACECRCVQGLGIQVHGRGGAEGLAWTLTVSWTEYPPCRIPSIPKDAD